MKKFIFSIVALSLMMISTSSFSANETHNEEAKGATQKILVSENPTTKSGSETSSLNSPVVTEKSEITKKIKKNKPTVSKTVLLVLAILIPWLAVGLATNWDITKTVIALLLTCCFWIPGIIYAFIVVNGN